MNLNEQHGNTLLRVARAAIDEVLGGAGLPLPDEGWLYKPGAAFVTLKLAGELRGCIGSLAAERPLGEDVQRNAVNAALRDPRFPSLTRDEFFSTRVEVTVLSALESFAAATQQECIEQLRPGVDGLVIAWGHRRATFIPQVWEQLPEPGEFLKYLKRKAGIPIEFWDESMRLHRFTAQKWKDDGFGE